MSESNSVLRDRNVRLPEEAEGWRWGVRKSRKFVDPTTRNP